MVDFNRMHVSDVVKAAEKQVASGNSFAFGGREEVRAAELKWLLAQLVVEQRKTQVLLEQLLEKGMMP